MQKKPRALGAARGEVGGASRDIRNVASPHWRRWLELENRCVVPSSSFSDNEVFPDGMRPPVWLASMRTGR
jgi:putative SOS response-associated peptidase YedK